MTPKFTDSALSFLRAVADLFMRGLENVLAMPWPQRLAFCVAAALLVCILPLAITIFLVLALLKLLIGAFAVQHTAPKRRMSDEERTIDAGDHV